MKISEAGIQKLLYRWTRKSCYLFVDNIYLFSGESDFVTFKKHGICTEYEIKLSRSDYKKDFSKKTKHKHLIKAFIAVTLGKKPKSFYVPNYFYYVCPENLIRKEEIPSYAGLIYGYNLNSISSGNFKVVKRAVRLNYKNFNNADVLKKVAISLSHRKFR